MKESKVKETIEEIKSSRRVLHAPKPTPKHETTKHLAPDKLVLLIAVVNREKGEYFLDFLQSFANMQLASAAYGTAAKSFGLIASETEKTVIFSLATRENAKMALMELEKKFATIRRGKGVAFTVPMTCTIGVAIYKFLCNKE